MEWMRTAAAVGRLVSALMSQRPCIEPPVNSSAEGRRPLDPLVGRTVGPDGLLACGKGLED